MDGEERGSVGIELKITQGGETARERWTFFGDDDGWRLFRIEQYVYRQA